MKDMEKRLVLLSNELPSENLPHIDEQKQIPKLSSAPLSLLLPPHPSKQTQDTSQLWRKQYEQSRKEIEELKIENHTLRLEITSMNNQLQTTVHKIE
jgi:septal ring factor EnvC (AmiA/AmiB activator)